MAKLKQPTKLKILIEEIMKEHDFSEEEIEHAYNVMHDEYGYTVTYWELDVLKRRVLNYCKDTENSM